MQRWKGSLLSSLSQELRLKAKKRPRAVAAYRTVAEVCDLNSRIQVDSNEG